MPNKHLMIAVRDSASCRQGVRFVGAFFQNRQPVDITLFYVAPSRSSNFHDMAAGWGDEKETTDKAQTGEAEKIMHKCSSYLMQRGYASAQLTMKIKPKKSSTVTDILAEGRAGRYDAVVLGRRSSSFLEDIITGNVSNEILARDLEFPLWFCRDPEEERKGILLTLDGSPAGMRAADHVGYMLQEEPRHNVTLFHVNKGQADIYQEKMFGEATRVLLEYGIEPERISSLTVKSITVVKTILDTIEKKKYGAVAIGWTGRSRKKGVTDWLIGEKCKRLLRDIDKAALWVVP